MTSRATKDKLVDEVTTFWASAMDAMLQEFKKHMHESDGQAKAVAITKVAQLSLLQYQYFDASLKDLPMPEEVKKACHEACLKVKHMVDKHIGEMERIGEGREEYPATIRDPKRLN